MAFQEFKCNQSEEAELDLKEYVQGLKLEFLSTQKLSITAKKGTNQLS
jgi:hypothetical protein